MISEAELIVDRRRLKRKLTLWRILAVLLAVAAIAALVWEAGGRKRVEPCRADLASTASSPATRRRSTS